MGSELLTIISKIYTTPTRTYHFSAAEL